MFSIVDKRKAFREAAVYRTQR